MPFTTKSYEAIYTQRPRF